MLRLNLNINEPVSSAIDLRQFAVSDKRPSSATGCTSDRVYLFNGTGSLGGKMPLIVVELVAFLSVIFRLVFCGGCSFAGAD